MHNTFGMPGPGGSLGSCAFCGAPFLAEILLGETVKSFTVTGCDQTLYGHAECIRKYGRAKLDPRLLPDESPLRKAWEEANAKLLNKTI